MYVRTRVCVSQQETGQGPKRDPTPFLGGVETVLLLSVCRGKGVISVHF